MITLVEILERRKRVCQRLREFHSHGEFLKVERDNCIFITWKKKSS